MDDEYSIAAHLAMVADRRRVQAYREALRRAVRPGCAVADIGSGTGIFAILACRLGARRAYAIEPATVVEAARRIAADNGVADRVEFLAEPSTRACLPEPVDLVVSDVRGVLPWHGGSIGTVVDARERLLAEGGELIPRRDRVWAALARARAPHPYDAAALEDPELDVDLSAARRFAANAWRRVTLARDELVVEAQEWAILDYATVDSPHAGGTLEWMVPADTTANGLCVWFDTDLFDGVGFSNAPGEPATIYGQAFFPFEAPLELARGDTVTVDVEARLVDEDYAWRWDTRVTAPGGEEPRLALSQSTVRATPVSLSRLRRREAGHRPRLGEDGEIDRLALSLMDGETALADIARRLAESFPERFAGADDALGRVAELSERYGG